MKGDIKKTVKPNMIDSSEIYGVYESKTWFIWSVAAIVLILLLAADVIINLTLNN